MPYTHFRYIAYQVPTVASTTPIPTGASAIYGIPPGAPPPLPPDIQLQGNVAGLGADAQVRVQRLIAVLLAAARSVAPYPTELEPGELVARPGPGINGHLDNDQTLKVFLAPEFYFRPEQPNVSYTYDQYKAIKDVLRKTIAVYSSTYFADWLIIPGTILWEWAPGNPLHPRRPVLPGERVYMNSAVYIYAVPKNQQSHVIEKVQASRIDGIPTGRHGPVAPGFNTAGAQASNEAWTRYVTMGKLTKHFFTVANVRVGLEICLEHALYPTGIPNFNRGVIRRVLETGVGAIKLQLLISGGMPIQAQSVATEIWGTILHTDGYAGSFGTNDRSVSGYADQWIPSGTPGYGWSLEVANFGPPCPNAPPLGLAALGLAIPPVGDPTYWASKPQLVRVYDPQALP